MPQYVNPDNPNAGELIVTKVDPVTGIAVQVNPNVTPGFLMPQADPRDQQQDEPGSIDLACHTCGRLMTEIGDSGWYECPDHTVGERRKGPTVATERKDDPKPAKKTSKEDKAVKPVEKAGEKTESPAPATTRGTVTTHSATATHVDDKK